MDKTTAQAIVASLHDALDDSWFWSWSDEVIEEAAASLDIRKRATVAAADMVATAVMKANAFTQYDPPGSLGYRQLRQDIAAAVRPTIADYHTFLHYQLDLAPLRGRAKRPAEKCLPARPEHMQAVYDYVAAIARDKVILARDFPPNVVDLVAIRALRRVQATA